MRFIAFHAKVALPQRVNPPPRTRVRNRCQSVVSDSGKGLRCGKLVKNGGSRLLRPNGLAFRQNGLCCMVAMCAFLHMSTTGTA
jgi:hypothetical protein